MVLGKMTSATQPSSACSAMRRSPFQFLSLVSDVRLEKGLEYLLRQASNSSRYLSSR